MSCVWCSLGFEQLQYEPGGGVRCGAFPIRFHLVPLASQVAHQFPVDARVRHIDGRRGTVVRDQFHDNRPGEVAVRWDGNTFYDAGVLASDLSKEEQ